MMHSLLGADACVCPTTPVVTLPTKRGAGVKSCLLPR